MIQLLHQAVILQQGNEQAGADHAQPGMLPADKGFRAGKDRRFLTHVKLRLVIDPEVTVYQRFLEIVQQLFFIQLGFVQDVIVIGNGLFITGASGVRRHLGPVETALDVNVFVYIGIYAHAQTDTVV